VEQTSSGSTAVVSVVVDAAGKNGRYVCEVKHSSVVHV